MYALHPGSLPPKDPLGKTRTQVTADDLVKLYKLKSWEYIVWDPTDHFDWFDFIHLYPNYYGRYARNPDGTPEKDVPDANSRPSPPNTLPHRRDAAKPPRSSHRR